MRFSGRKEASEVWRAVAAQRTSAGDPQGARRAKNSALTILDAEDVSHNRPTFPRPVTAKIRLPEVPEVCSCGNRFDGDNLCMISACEQET